MRSLSTLIVAASLLCGLTASATSIQVAETATLTSFDVDPALELKDVTAGSVTLRYADQTVTLVLVGNQDRHEITLPLVEKGQDCGSYVYTAKLDSRPTDGALQELIVQDNRTRTCADFTSDVVVTYRTETLRGQKTSSTFSGSALSAAGPVVETANLKVLSTDGAVSSHVRSGILTLDRRARTLKLTYMDDICPANAGRVRCMAVSRQYAVELPIVSEKDDGCGSILIQARADRRPVDGPLEEVSVLDNRGRVCRDNRPNLTEVTYHFELLRPNSQGTITFGGAALQQ